MEVTDAPRIEINDGDRVANAFETLQQRHYSDLRLECVATGERFDIDDFRVEAGCERIRLTIDVLGLARDRFAAGVRLHASLGVEALLFTGIEVQQFSIEADPPELIIAKPERVYVSNKRESTRIRLVRGMRALVQLQVYEDRNPIDARLMDLSLGGCGIEIALRTGMLLECGQQIAALFIEFPNGTRSSLAAVVRHVQMAERNAHAYVGFSFVQRDGNRLSEVPVWLREMEREIAFRAGQGRNHMIQPSRLFIGGTESPVAIRLDQQEKTPYARTTAMVGPLRDIAHKLGVTAIALRHGRALPIDALYECADTLCQLLEQDRPTFLYALCCLSEQPALLHHCIVVAGRLADLVQGEETLARNLRDIVVAALVHDLGNIRQAGPQTASADTLITDPSAPTNSHHELIEALGSAGSWAASGARRAIIECLNSTDVDISGLPVALASLARAARIVDLIEVKSRGGIGNHEAAAPLQVFRSLYHSCNDDEREWLKRYMKRQGIYPIGSLVHCSSGFLAWVLQLGEDGQPSRIRVVRSLQNPRRLNQILGRADFSQIGKIDEPALPQRFGLSPF
ncbi:metal dependent phosphohydrolase [Salinisphaera sp. S4-8]|uniref:PilZ domain-containing protein n=1 Tax=Salinisphaera sp. S4-8 TaxID=633357 RepID=UPI00334009C9